MSRSEREWEWDRLEDMERVVVYEDRKKEKD